MTAAELIQAVNNAESKIELEALLIDLPHIAIDKRKALGTLKDEILDVLEGQVELESIPTRRDEDELSFLATNVVLPELTGEVGQAAIDGVLLVADPLPATVIGAAGEFILPEIDSVDEVEHIEPEITNRILVNTKTGVVFLWTPQLAKLAHFREI
jgi:hypothetical protein